MGEIEVDRVDEVGGLVVAVVGAGILVVGVGVLVLSSPNKNKTTVFYVLVDERNTLLPILHKKTDFDMI